MYKITHRSIGFIHESNCKNIHALLLVHRKNECNLWNPINSINSLNPLNPLNPLSLWNNKHQINVRYFHSNTSIQFKTEKVKDPNNNSIPPASTNSNNSSNFSNAPSKAVARKIAGAGGIFAKYVTLGVAKTLIGNKVQHVPGSGLIVTQNNRKFKGRFIKIIILFIISSLVSLTVISNINYENYPKLAVFLTARDLSLNWIDRASNIRFVPNKNELIQLKEALESSPDNMVILTGISRSSFILFAFDFVRGVTEFFVTNSSGLSRFLESGGRNYGSLLNDQEFLKTSIWWANLLLKFERIVFFKRVHMDKIFLIIDYRGKETSSKDLENFSKFQEDIKSLMKSNCRVLLLVDKSLVPYFKDVKVVECS